VADDDEVSSISPLAVAPGDLPSKEKLLRAVFDSALDAMLVADDDGRFIDANPAACALFGLEKEGLLGRRIGELAGSGHTPSASFESFLDVARVKGEFSLVRGDGDERHLEYAAVANVLPGLHLSILRDVTDRTRADAALRDAAQRLRAVISHAPIILFSFDQNGLYTLHEGKGVESLGLRPGQLVGQSVLARQRDTPGADDGIRRALGGEQMNGDFETGGKSFDCTLVPIRNESGAVIGVTGVAVDISPRKRAEEALRASEARFRQIIEGSHDAVALLSDKLEVIYESRAVRRVLGYTLDGACNPRWYEHVDDEQRPLLARAFKTLTATPHGTLSFDFCIRHPDGSKRWLQLTATSLLHEPDVAALVTNFRDITERKASEAALRASQRMMEVAQTVAELGSWTSGATLDDRIAWSAECARIFGWETDVAPTVSEFFLMVHPDDRARVVAASERAIAQGRACETEHRIVRPSGEVRCVSARAVIEGTVVWDGSTASVGKDELGRSYGVVGVVQDITERTRVADELRASDLRYRRIVENTSEGVCTYDRSGNLTFVNSRMAEILGVTVEEAMGQPLYAFMDEAETDAARQRVANRKRGLREQGEFRLKRRDGTDIWAVLHSDPLLDEAGNFEAALVLVTDITEQKKSDMALHRAEEQLRQSQKMEAVGVLAGGIAHDFNNLLSVILSYTELLVEDLKPTDPMRADLEAIHKAGQRASELTSQLLAFGRKQVMQPVVIALDDIVEGIESMLRRTLGEDVELVVRASGDAGNIHADPGQVAQILMNLVVNARDAMPAGGHLLIETSHLVVVDGKDAAEAGVRPGSYALLAVTDTGTGMDAATRARIFEPFYTTKEKGKGTGLGLSTVYGIVQQTGGHVEVCSEPGRGTAFKIFLPRTARAANSTHPASIVPRAVDGDETILLVDDEQELRGVVRSILSKHGYHVIDAQSAGDALIASEQFAGEIHLLLTDVVMPRMNGRQLAERLSSLRPGMKVLFMSGYTDDAVVHHGVLDRTVEFLQKPIVPNALLQKVRNVISG
jgi:two-component system cell cycle sensor histidine kinase/response regulator CckA